jgi:DNA polymerase-3 subunit delta
LRDERLERAKDPIASLVKEASSGRVPPLVWLYGEDQGRISRLIQELRKLLLREEVRSLNEAAVDAKEIPPERIWELARGLPMLSQWRLIVVDNASEISQRSWEKALDYLRRPAPTTCLVFRAQKSPPAGEVSELLREKGVVVEVRPRSEASALDWIEEAARGKGKRITRGASRLLLELVGTDESSLDGELEKLASFVGEGDLIEEHHVQEITAGVRMRTLFQLTDAIGEGRPSEALKIMDRLMDQGTSPLAAMGMLARQLRLLQAALLWRRGETHSSLGPDRISEFLREKLLRQSAQWSEERILKALRGLAWIDRKVKSGRLEARWLLDRWILQLGP